MIARPPELAPVAAPRPIEPPQPFHFPFVATIAPVIVSVAMWALTQSPFALMFAALGPVVAVASLADSRIQSRRAQRAERARFAADLAFARRAVLAGHSAELAALDDATPTAAAIAARIRHDPARWKADASAVVPVTLGRGTVPSRLRLDGATAAAGHGAPDTVDLADLAATLERAPVVVDARNGVGVFGGGPVAVAAARSIALQLAWALSPAAHWVSVTPQGEDWAWLDLLPHPRGPELTSRPEATIVAFGAVGEQSPLATVAVSAVRAALPGTQRVVVRADRSSGAVVDHPELDRRGALAPGLVSGEEALLWANAARLAAEADGVIAPTRALPHEVSLGSLAPGRGGGPGLCCAFAVGPTGPLTLDLVEDGPHAVVGGTTGSGKSELLCSWILAMAATRSPAEVTFLLVDFKGGSAFGALDALPHTVGVITDLDEIEAARAFESLRAELRHRERVLAQSGAKHIGALPPHRLARLVVVVDEFAAMMADYPDLHAVFSDIAARGRALGVHLVLCTQRPAAVARDSVLANADLRISLRVNNRADSIAVVGSDAAAAIPVAARGRAVVSTAARPGVVAQVALAAPADAVATAAAWPGPWRPRRPWCAPLPGVLPLERIPRRPGVAVFGMVDLPAEQRQEPAWYDPAAHGNLLVVGAHRSGRSTALATLAEAVGATVERVPCEVESAWDAVTAVARAESALERLVLLDDLDALVARFGDEHRAAFLERLALGMRDGPARGIHFVLGAQRLTGELQPVVALAPARLILRQSNRQDHLLAGGQGAFDGRLVPGAGEWLGARVQVAMPAVAAFARSSAGTAAQRLTGPSEQGLRPSPAPRPTTTPQAVPAALGTRPLAVVSSRPGDMASRLGPGWAVAGLDEARAQAQVTGLAVTAGGTRTAIVGDQEAWQSHWGALAALRPTCDVLFDGCTAADFRALTRLRELPPAIADPRVSGWILRPDGTVERVPIPLVPPAPNE